eukprot:SAG25_NODE_1920_length_2145_cov_2.107038_3_plen_87_part_00
MSCWLHRAGAVEQYTMSSAMDLVVLVALPLNCAIMLPPLCSPPKHAIMPVMLPPPHYAEIYASLGRNAQETSELHLQCIICIGALC